MTCQSRFSLWPHQGSISTYVSRAPHPADIRAMKIVQPQMSRLSATITPDPGPRRSLRQGRVDHQSPAIGRWHAQPS